MSRISSAFLILLVFACPAAVPAQDRADPCPVVRLPLAFEPDAAGTAWTARGPGYHAVVDGDALTLVPTAAPDARPVRIALADAGSTTVVPSERLRGVAHYLVGRDAEQWRTDVPRYTRLRCDEVLPGVGLEFYGAGRRLEYDLLLAAGVSPGAVRLRIDGSAPVRLLDDGSLEIPAGDVTLVQEPPVAWQEEDGRRQDVPTRYVLHDDGTVGFHVEAHDPALPLRIDPVIAYATFLGGSGADAILDVATDAAGNLYLVGYTTSADFPLRTPIQSSVNGLYDIFVTKLDPTGTVLIWSTYLGGSGGYGVAEWALAVAVDSQGRPAVIGLTGNADFPTANAFQPALAGKQDAVVFRLAATGDRLDWSTYLGGSNDESWSLSIGGGAGGVFVDASGAVVVAGSTRSADFPTRNARQPVFGGVQDVFVTRFDPAGRVVYSTYLGGPGFDGFGDLAPVPGPSGHVVLAGGAGLGWPTTAGVWDPALRHGGFVTRFDPGTQQIVWSTGFPASAAVAVDPGGAVYLAGGTSSRTFPTTMGAHQVDHGDSFNSHPVQGFVAKLDAGAKTLVYGTYYGSPSGNESFHDLAVDAFGHAYAVGTRSTHFSRLIETAIAVKLNTVGSALVYGVEVGRSDSEGRAALLRSAGSPGSPGSLWVVGETWAPGWATAGALQPVHGGNLDGFLARVEDTAPRVVAVTLPVDRLAASSVVGAVTLDGAAPLGGVTVQLGSSSPALQVPASVIVPAGSATATFQATGTRVAVDVQVTLTAAWAGSQDTTSVRVWPGPVYSIEGIAVPGASNATSSGDDINALGVVVGNTDLDFFTFDDNGLRVVGPGAGYGINEAGEIGGGSAAQAMSWSPVTGLRVIGALQPGMFAVGYDIDAAGGVVGHSDFFTGSFYTQRAFRWSAATGMQNLGTLGGDSSEARATNRHGAVTGRSSPAPGLSHAFLWTAAAGMQDLGTLPGHGDSIGFDVNDAGLVTGQSSVSPGSGMEAFLWRAGAGMAGLGTLPNETDSGGRGLNLFGHVVGWSGPRPNGGRAVIHDGTSMRALDDLLSAEDAFEWDLGTAEAVNDRGEIAGTGTWRRNGRAATAFRLRSLDYRPFGAGCAGRDARVSAMNGSGRPVPGSTVQILVSGRPGAAALIVVGLQTVSVPLGGGCDLLVLPLVDSGWFVLSPAGTAALPLAIPPGLAPFTALLQAAVVDAASGNGSFTTSNGMAVRVL